MDTITLTPDIRHLIETTFRQQQEFAPRAARTGYRERVEKLDRIYRYLKTPRHVEALARAMHKDLRKPEVEVLASELGIVEGHIRFVRRQLHHWMRDRRVATPLHMLGTSSYIHYEPKGVCLILAPWNYPLNLAIVPLVYALAAGNTVVVKPSEIAPKVSSFIRRMIGELFEDQEVAVFEGDASVAKALLELPFNHIFFTGSPQVGRQVMRAAARHLASVTLELGGKSPAIVDESARVRTAARRTAWAKCFNTGQTCIAPDYLLVHQSRYDAFIRNYRQAVQEFYDPGGEGIQRSKDYGRIINERHFERLRGLYEDALEQGGQVISGGVFDEEDLYIAPTLLGEVHEGMRIMQEEIFGPILPVIPFQDPMEAVRIIGRKPKPLTMYINATDRHNIDRYIRHSSAGGTLINEYLLGYNNPHLPFGGVNNSGIGRSLGRRGFEEFSNERSIIRRHWGSLSMIFPPYKAHMKRILDLFIRLF